MSLPFTKQHHADKGTNHCPRTRIQDTGEHEWGLVHQLGNREEGEKEGKEEKQEREEKKEETNAMFC